MLDPDACYRALAAHDARFDGAFFVGVKTTGIYCRPVCRARTPRRDRCEFFPLAVLAEQAGFRACFRCRPERAPEIRLAPRLGTRRSPPGEAPAPKSPPPENSQASVDAVSRLVATAVRRIEAGALNQGGVEALAKNLGVSARHLRRSLQNALGVGPVELALSKRIALARELLHGTALPVTEIAFASGFSSVRRFNDAYRASQKMAPSDLRRRALTVPRAIRPRETDGDDFDSVFRIVLDVRPPFDPESAFAFLRARAIPGLESFVDARSSAGSPLGERYQRTVTIDGVLGTIAIFAAPKSKPAWVVELSAPLGRSLMAVASRVRRMFDTDADVVGIGEHLSRDLHLAPLIAARPALRVIGAFDPFEGAVRAILGQQISVRGARTIAGRLVEKFGPFDAVRLANAHETAIAEIGLPRARAHTIHGLARAVADGTLVLDRDSDPQATREALLALPGIGPWTAEYIDLRVLGRADAFPAGDLVLRKAMAKHSHATDLWRPWRAYAATHLWAAEAKKSP